MDIITADFETYYDREYSLSKLTTEAYIRDSRFEPLMLTLMVNDGDVLYFSGDKDIRDALNSLDLHKKAFCAHNAAFDAAILSFRYGIKPAVILDTLSMARPKHAMTTGCSLAALARHYKLVDKGTEVKTASGKRRKDFTDAEWAAYIQYCKHDTQLCRQLFKLLVKDFPMDEIQLIDTTIRMYTEPFIQLDRPLLEHHLVEERERKANLVSMMGLPEQFTQDAVKKVLMSNDKFADYLRLLGVEPPTKISPATGRKAYAFSKTDMAFRDLLNCENELVVRAVEARLGVKTTLEETRTERLLDAETRGSLPLMLTYYGAHTGRFCLTGDTFIVVLRNNIPLGIMLKDLQNSDLVWDGEEFVQHGGLAYRGKREVITYSGITGTPDHKVFINEQDEAVGLLEASIRGYTLAVARSPYETGVQVSLADSDY